MTSDLVTVISVGAAVIAVGIAIWQTVLTRRSIQAQSYINLEGLETSSSFREGVREILAIPYSDYTMFLSQSSATKKLIFDTVSFLNFVAHLVDEGFLSRDKVLRLYAYSYLICNDKLLDWWLVGVQQTDGHRGAYATFERMCHYVVQINQTGQLARWAKGRAHKGF